MDTWRRHWSEEAVDPSHEGKQKPSDGEELWDMRPDPCQRTTPGITKESRPAIAHSGGPHAVPQITPGNSPHSAWSKRLSFSCLLTSYPISSSSLRRSAVCWGIETQFPLTPAHLPQRGAGPQATSLSLVSLFVKCLGETGECQGFLQLCPFSYFTRDWRSGFKFLCCYELAVTFEHASSTRCTLL